MVTVQAGVKTLECWFLHHTAKGYQHTLPISHKCWLVQEGTALGKDLSNPFIAAGLLKNQKVINVPYPYKTKHWLVLSKRLQVKTLLKSVYMAVTVCQKLLG